MCQLLHHLRLIKWRRTVTKPRPRGVGIFNMPILMSGLYLCQFFEISGFSISKPLMSLSMLDGLCHIKPLTDGNELSLGTLFGSHHQK